MSAAAPRNLVRVTGERNGIIEFEYGVGDLSLDPATGAYLFVANEGSGAVTLLGIDAETGKLKESGQTAAVPSARYVLIGR